jgi:putative RNA 2'-phosphotransferase
VPVDIFLAALRQERADWRDLTERDLAEMIRTSSKRRHELANGRIRALYGHSVPDRLSKAASRPPPELFHGTAPSTLPHIQRSGLQPMTRQYVHLSTNRADALAVGRRKSPTPILLFVRAAEAAAAGTRFYIGNEKVWLADEVPWAFISVVPDK